LFRPVPAEADFTALEADELARWGVHRVFERSVELRAGAEPWVFYEGPPTANGRPGLHHVWARVYKDLFCRYRTMRGYAVPRKAGWDTHGLPVEVEVEKQLGITAKRQIEEEVGIAEFTRLCRESVRNYVDEWKALTERIGYWIDIDAAYWTFSPPYVESVWWNLKSLWDQGLLYEDIKVGPVLPAVRHRPVQPRARAARRLPRGGGRVRLRAIPADGTRGRPPNGCEPPSVGARWTGCRWWCGRPPRGRCCPTPAPPWAPTSSTPWWTARWWRPIWSNRCSARGRSSITGCPGATWSGLRYRRPFDDLTPGPSGRPGRVAGGGR
jgi:hypothetical protein